ncbi:phosphotransferase [Arthrobacter sp. HLT1-21]
MQRALDGLALDLDAPACWEVWLRATASAWASKPVWFHGDVAVGNLLTRDGRLSALIDFGTCGIGDPACDLVMAWTYFSPEERQIFRNSVGLDADAWHRARGWAL